MRPGAQDSNSALVETAERVFPEAGVERRNDEYALEHQFRGTGGGVRSL